MQQPDIMVLSDRAYLAVTVEARKFPDRETGGIFLGKRSAKTWYVLEVIDPGYRRTIRQAAYFEYDQEYVTHLSNVMGRLYNGGLELLGLWHRHPGSFDRFSVTDDGTNARFAEKDPSGALSVLVNIDPDLRFTAFHVRTPLSYRRIHRVTVGDAHIPQEVKALARINGERVMERNRSTQDKGQGVWTSVKRAFLPDSAQESPPLPAEDRLFRMLETELDTWLERQTAYAYDLKIAGRAIDITLRLQKPEINTPERVRCRLFLQGDHGICQIDGCRYPYSRGVIKGYIDDRIDRNRRMGACASGLPTDMLGG